MGPRRRARACGVRVRRGAGNVARPSRVQDSWWDSGGVFSIC